MCAAATDVTASSFSNGVIVTGEQSTIAQQAYATYEHGDLDAFFRLLAPDGRVIFPGVPPLSGPEQIRPFLQAQLTAFPNGRQTVRRMIEQGSTVAAELTFRRAHRTIRNTGRRDSADRPPGDIRLS